MLEGLRRAAERAIPPRHLFPGLGRARAGVAVGPSDVTAVLPRRGLGLTRPGRVLRRSLPRGPGDDGEGWPELTAAFRDLRTRLESDAESPRLDVSLRPPLARVRAVRLPPARRSELRRLLRREISRHFLEVPPDPTIDAAPSARGTEAPCVALCAPAGTVAAVAGSAEDAGWTVGLMTGSDWAAAEAVARLERSARRGGTTVALEGPDRRALVEMDGGRFAGVRPGSRPVEEESDPPPSFRAGPDGGGPSGLSSGALAALGAMVAPDEGPTVAPPETRAAERRRRRVRAAVLGGTAVALGGLAATVHLWGLDRETDALRSVRSESADRVSRLTAAREAADVLGDVVGSLADVAGRRSEWAALVADLGDRLPSSARLESVSTTDEGLAVTGRARSPSALVPALEASPRVREAAIAGVTRTEEPDTDGFRLELTLAAPPPRPSDGGATP